MAVSLRESHILRSRIIEALFTPQNFTGDDQLNILEDVIVPLITQ